MAKAAKVNAKAAEAKSTYEKAKAIEDMLIKKALAIKAVED